MSNRRKPTNGAKPRPTAALLITGNITGEPDRLLAVSDPTPWRKVAGTDAKACYHCYFTGADADPYVDATQACVTDTGGTVFLCARCTDNWSRGHGQYALSHIEPLLV